MASWIVIQNAVVVAVHDEDQNLFKIYDTSFNWFLSNTLPEFDTEVDMTELTYTIDPSEDLADGDDSTPPRLIELNGNVFIPNNDVPDPRLAMTVADAKLAVLSMLNARIMHEILLQYPTQTQITIRALGVKPGGGNYASSDVTTMDTFINGKNTLRNTKTTEINAKTTVADLIAYNVYA